MKWCFVLLNVPRRCAVLKLCNVQKNSIGRPVSLETYEFNWRTTTECVGLHSTTKTVARVLSSLKSCVSKAMAYFFRKNRERYWGDVICPWEQKGRLGGRRGEETNSVNDWLTGATYYTAIGRGPIPHVNRKLTESGNWISFLGNYNNKSQDLKI